MQDAIESRGRSEKRVLAASPGAQVQIFFGPIMPAFAGRDWLIGDLDQAHQIRRNNRGETAIPSGGVLP